MENYGSLKTDVEVLKREVLSIHTFSAKIDDAIEKMAEVSNSISKMLIMHENKLQNHDQMIDGIKLAMSERKNDFDKQVELLHSRITAMKEENHIEREKYHRELLSALKEISDSQRAMEARITTLENWRWYILGAAGALGFILAQVPWDKFFFV